VCAVLGSHSGLAPVELPTPVLLFALPASSAHLQFALAAPVTVQDMTFGKLVWC
jgi:hypothetical protein